MITGPIPADTYPHGEAVRACIRGGISCKLASMMAVNQLLHTAAHVSTGNIEISKLLGIGHTYEILFGLAYRL